MLSEWPKHALREGGLLADGLVLGWCPSWASEPPQRLDLNVLPSSHYATVALSIAQPDEECVASLALEQPLLASAIMRSTHLLTAWTSAGRSQLGYALQVSVWRVLGELTGGVLYDEVSGDLMGYVPRIGYARRDKPTPEGPEEPIAARGSLAPDFELYAQDGSTFRLHMARDKPVTLWFIPSSLDSPVCEAETEVLARYQEMIARHTFLIGLGPFSRDALAAFATKFGLKFPLLADSGQHLYNQESQRRSRLGVPNQLRELPSVVATYDAYQERAAIVIGADRRIRERYQRGEPGRVVFDLLKCLKAIERTPTM